jgi:hypothetical protein
MDLLDLSAFFCGARFHKAFRVSRSEEDAGDLQDTVTLAGLVQLDRQLALATWPGALACFVNSFKIHGGKDVRSTSVDFVVKVKACVPRSFAFLIVSMQPVNKCVN